MSNLLEKGLLTAFGIFVLINFISLFFPLWNQLIINNGILNNEYNAYSNLIDEIDDGIQFVIDNPHEISEKIIDYPENMNISMNNSFVNYEYCIKNTSYYEKYSYNCSFFSFEYKGMMAQIYRLKIFYKYNLMEIHFY